MYGNNAITRDSIWSRCVCNAQRACRPSNTIIRINEITVISQPKSKSGQVTFTPDIDWLGWIQSPSHRSSFIFGYNEHYNEEMTLKIQRVKPTSLPLLMSPLLHIINAPQRLPKLSLLYVETLKSHLTLPRQHDSEANEAETTFKCITWQAAVMAFRRRSVMREREYLWVLQILQSHPEHNTKKSPDKERKTTPSIQRRTWMLVEDSTHMIRSEKGLVHLYKK